MNRRNIPASVYEKLLQLAGAAEHLAGKVTETEQAIASARTRLSGGLREQSKYDDLQATLRQLVADKPVLAQRLHSAQSVLSNCKAWLKRLPQGTTLEPVATDVSGHTLEQVHNKLAAAQAELTALRAVPTPSADIEEHIRHYVHSMARPQITGIGRGERLKVVWPGAGWDIKGPIEHRAEVLPMMALLFPDAMVGALMRAVERMANDPLPQAARQKRIAALEHQIEQLAYVEEALVAAAIVNGDDVQRSPSAPPQAVLQVRVAEAVKSSRAA
jgi:hypothetical protein